MKLRHLRILFLGYLSAYIKYLGIATIVIFISKEAIHAQAESPVTITIDPSTPGPVINKNIFGHFAEHLGRGIYEGIWVGVDSEIPNTRGLRNDVIEALKVLKVPYIRWPGGCFADKYHWRDGIGQMDERKTRINATWAGRKEPNTFGTHEYFDLLEQIGAEAFISANVGSGTVQEAADWLEYLTATGSTLALERARNGHPEPYEVAYWGIGNEVWVCGGPLTAEEYLTELKKYSNFSKNYNKKVRTKQVAVGPDGDAYFEFTEVIMKAWAEMRRGWNIQALSLHRYTRDGLPPTISATDFDEQEYAFIIKETLGMEAYLSFNEAIMDKYDPEKKVSILVDEWGTWYAPKEGTDPGFLEQQNSQRDAIVAALNFNIFIRHAERVQGANIAQMINVLQAMILTENEKMVLTPTYHSFRLYVPFQNSTRLPVAYKEGEYQIEDISLPRIDAIAAKGDGGEIYFAVTNLDPNQSVEINLVLKDFSILNAKGETLYAPSIDAINTIDKPHTVFPKRITPTFLGSNLSITVQPQSVTVITINANTE